MHQNVSKAAQNVDLFWIFMIKNKTKQHITTVCNMLPRHSLLNITHWAFKLVLISFSSHINKAGKGDRGSSCVVTYGY